MYKGKAGSLQYLKDHGLNVPEWKIIKHSEILSWGNENLWKEFCLSLRSRESTDSMIKLDCFLQSMAIPTVLINSLVEQGPYAIRSSASVEDSKDNSFAGIFTTKLFVNDHIENAIIEVWASLFSTPALQYCQERNVELDDLTMDVIIQKMINGDKSGVLFQADPTGLVTHQIIVAGWGLGQGIVDDVTDTDRYIIEGTEIITSHITHKQIYTEHDPDKGQVIEKHVSIEKTKVSVLNEKEIDKLLSVSEKLSTNNDTFLDIEFTFKGNDLYVLQARPITTIPSKRNLLIFDNSNIAENYPHQSTPMTFSALRRGYAANFKNLIAYLGFPEGERRLLDNNLEQLVGYWGGQIYYNLNNWYSVYGLLPFGGEKAVKSFNEMVGIKITTPIKTPERGIIRNIQLLMVILPKFTSYYFLTLKHHKEYKLQFKSLHQGVKARSIEAKNAHDIINLLQHLDTRYLEIIQIPLLNDFFSSLLNHTCRSLVKRLAGAQGERIYNDLLSNREDLESSKAIYSLIDLAQTVSLKKELLDFLETNIKNSLVMNNLKEFDSQFYQKLSQHFDSFGDRSQWEMKVEVPTAREAPETTLKLIINYAKAGLSQEEQKLKEKEKASKARDQLNTIARTNPLTKFIFWRLFNKCSQALSFREDARFDRVRYKGQSRTLLLKLGDVLVRKDLIENKEDLFYLTIEEMNSLQYDSYGSGYMKELIELRKRHLLKLKELSLPDRIIVNDLSHVEKFSEKKIINSKDHVFGIPCSGGKVESECVVVLDLNDAPDLKGKILVAHRTDPAWGYFFVGVKGIIIEKGSMLSHAAIISRELGIPCIINVKDATSIFNTGMKLSMDGASGEIQVMN